MAEREKRRAVEEEARRGGIGREKRLRVGDAPPLVEALRIPRSEGTREEKTRNRQSDESMQPQHDAASHRCENSSGWSQYVPMLVQTDVLSGTGGEFQ